LILNESIDSGNDLNLGTNLATLANIYHNCGDHIQALELAKRALILLEGCGSSDSSALAAVLNNIGTIQVYLGLLNDALPSFVRASHMCKKVLPEGDPKRVAIENNIRRITQMQQNNDVNLYWYLWKFLPKTLLL
jgi:tetratricopeptide (TPR) repeat protein